jgi:PAS domain S-box-containing protein
MRRSLSRVIDTLPCLVWTSLPDGRADFVNQRWCEYTGVSFDDSCGAGWQAAIHPDDRPALLLQSLVSSGELEARLRRFDGEYRWCLLRTDPVTDDAGEAVGRCGVATDIEDRKRREEASEARGRNFQQIVDGLPEIVALFAADGKIVFCNKQMLEYLGETLEQVQAKASADNFHPDDRDEVLTQWAAAVQSGEPFDFEARLRRADGAFRWQRTRVFPLRNTEGRINLWYGLCTEIDDHKWAETLLAGEKRLLEMVAQGAPLGEVLGVLCGIVEDAAPGRLCSVLSIDPDGVRFQHGAGPSLPAAYNEVLDGLIMDRHYGPCGMAAKLKCQVIAEDVSFDPRWASSPWPALVAGHGLRSCWSTPIMSRDDKVIGVFALYQRQPASPSQREQELIRQFTHIASIAIERAQADASLRQSMARKAAILASALDCIITIDHEGRINEFNPAAERTFGYKRDEVVGKLLADAISPPSLREDYRRGLAPYLETGEVVGLGRRHETTAVRADGSKFPVELAITRIPVDDPPSFTCCLRDITERKHSEEELRRSEAFLAEAQHLSSTGSFSWCAATDEITWSRQLYCIFEFDQDIPVTLDLVLTRVHPEDISTLHDIVRWARGTGGDYEFEYRLQLPDQSVKYLHVAAHGSRDEEGRLLNVVGAVQDVTERRLAEQELNEVRSELARAVRAMSLGALTASIAHEVNQPLSGIITNANTCLRMLAADHPNVDGARETARRTIRDANRASEVITRLRALFGKKDPTAEPVDLNDAVREVIALSLSRFERDRVTPRTELAGDLPLVIGDRVQLQQVIQNLLQNASDAMSNVHDRPRRLLIRTERDDDDRVRLIVRDSGAGFEPQSLERLFDAFYSTKSGGMGIGLSVSRSIIESHRGRLWAAPNDDGPGATFSFSIPRLPEGVTSVRSLDAMRAHAGKA